MRTYAHIIDTAAVKATLNSIPDYWVVRDLSERDYGIDLMIEIFEELGTDRNGHKTFDATGHICYLQIKGTNTQFEYNNDGSLSYSLDKDSLLYTEKFPTAFILVRVCTLKGHQKIHFLWLQRYIMEMLDFENPDWRESDQDSFTLRLPSQNILPENSDKIELIAGINRHVAEAAEYSERYFDIENKLTSILHRLDEFQDYSQLFKELKRIKRLTTLLKRNNLCVGQDSIDDLIQYIQEVRDGHITPKEMEDFPHNFNREQLSKENESRIFMGTFLAENEEETAY